MNGVNECQSTPCRGISLATKRLQQTKHSFSWAMAHQLLCWQQHLPPVICKWARCLQGRHQQPQPQAFTACVPETSAGISCCGGYMGRSRANRQTHSNWKGHVRWPTSVIFHRTPQKRESGEMGQHSHHKRYVQSLRNTKCNCICGAGLSPDSWGWGHTGSISALWSLDTKGIFNLQFVQTSSFYSGLSSEDTLEVSVVTHPSYISGLRPDELSGLKCSWGRWGDF